MLLSIVVAVTVPKELLSCLVAEKVKPPELGIFVAPRLKCAFDESSQKVGGVTAAWVLFGNPKPNARPVEVVKTGVDEAFIPKTSIS